MRWHLFLTCVRHMYSALWFSFVVFSIITIISFVTQPFSYSVSKSFAEELRQSGTPCDADSQWRKLRQQQQQHLHRHELLYSYCNHHLPPITVVVLLPSTLSHSPRSFLFDDVRAAVGRVYAAHHTSLCVVFHIPQCCTFLVTHNLSQVAFTCGMLLRYHRIRPSQGTLCFTRTHYSHGWNKYKISYSNYSATDSTTCCPMVLIMSNAVEGMSFLKLFWLGGEKEEFWVKKNAWKHNSGRFVFVFFSAWICVLLFMFCAGSDLGRVCIGGRNGTNRRDLSCKSQQQHQRQRWYRQQCTQFVTSSSFDATPRSRRSSRWVRSHDVRVLYGYYLF